MKRPTTKALREFEEWLEKRAWKADTLIERQEGRMILREFRDRFGSRHKEWGKT